MTARASRTCCSSDGPLTPPFLPALARSVVDQRTPRDRDLNVYRKWWAIPSESIRGCPATSSGHRRSRSPPCCTTPRRPSGDAGCVLEDHRPLGPLSVASGPEPGPEDRLVGVD